MELKEAKKLIKAIGVKSWIESGNDIVKIGDKLIVSTDTFSRLDYYAKGKGVKFCEKRELKIPCGEIELNNGVFLRYNVL